jgi:hypothetical protein
VFYRDIFPYLQLLKCIEAHKDLVMAWYQRKRLLHDGHAPSHADYRNTEMKTCTSISHEKRLCACAALWAVKRHDTMLATVRSGAMIMWQQVMLFKIAKQLQALLNASSLLVTKAFLRYSNVKSVVIAEGTARIRLVPSPA